MPSRSTGNRNPGDRQQQQRGDDYIVIQPSDDGVVTAVNNYPSISSRYKQSPIHHQSILTSKQFQQADSATADNNYKNGNNSNISSNGAAMLVDGEPDSHPFQYQQKSSGHLLNGNGPRSSDRAALKNHRPDLGGENGGKRRIQNGVTYADGYDNNGFSATSTNANSGNTSRDGGKLVQNGGLVEKYFDPPSSTEWSSKKKGGGGCCTDRFCCPCMSLTSKAVLLALFELVILAYLMMTAVILYTKTEKERDQWAWYLQPFFAIPGWFHHPKIVLGVTVGFLSIIMLCVICLLQAIDSKTHRMVKPHIFGQVATLLMLLALLILALFLLGSQNLFVIPADSLKANQSLPLERTKRQATTPVTTASEPSINFANYESYDEMVLNNYNDEAETTETTPPAALMQSTTTAAVKTTSTKPIPPATKGGDQQAAGGGLPDPFAASQGSIFVDDYAEEAQKFLESRTTESSVSNGEGDGEAAETDTTMTTAEYFDSTGETVQPTTTTTKTTEGPIIYDPYKSGAPAKQADPYWTGISLILLIVFCLICIIFVISALFITIPLYYHLKRHQRMYPNAEDRETLQSPSDQIHMESIQTQPPKMTTILKNSNNHHHNNNHLHQKDRF